MLVPITRSRRSARHLRLIHGRRAALVGLVAAMVPSSLAVGIPNAPVKTWVPDGQVMSITPGAGSTAYVAGYFDQVGPQTGGSALIDGGTGVASTAWPTIVGDVYAVTPDGAGGWYVAGSFDRVGAEAIRNLAHIGADKTVDATFAPNPDGVVRSVVTKGTDVIIGGDFFVVAGQPRARLASVTAAGSLNAWNPGANGAVGALVVQGSTVYAGGSFTAISGSPRSYLAALDASSGSLIGWGGTPSGPVHALALSGTTLFVGGDFSTMNGQSAPSIAALTAATGASLAGWSHNFYYWMVMCGYFAATIPAS